MVRFEEEVVELWFHVRGYLTVKNIVYSSPVKRRGGKGWDEIDLLAVRLENNAIKDAVRCETSVSVTERFPFIDNKNEKADQVRSAIRKFFSKGAEEAIKSYLGSSSPMYRSQLIIGELADNWRDKFSGGLPREAGLLSVGKTELGYMVEIEYTPQDPEIEVGGVKRIEIITFNRVLEDLEARFREKKFTGKNFSDPTMRAIQWMIRLKGRQSTGALRRT